LGFGVLGIGPNPQSPIPNPQSPIIQQQQLKKKLTFNLSKNKNKKIKYKINKINKKKIKYN